jgi:23S rRNA pseudouridine2605 synthase
VLAQCGYGSLRGLEELIIAGRITVNRQPAEVGQKVGPNDQIRINGELVRLRFAPPRTRVLLYHKPTGEIVSRADPEGRPTVFDKLPRLGGAKWIAVGRLDFNSEGLLMFTTSGELANRLMHPRYEVEREYAVRIVGTLTPEQERALLEGIALDDGMGRVTSLSDGGGEGTNHWYKLTVPEGRNREVRRLFEALGLTVSRLIRTRYGVIAMPPQLKRGQMAELEQAELARLLQAAGMTSAAANGEREGDASGRPAQSGQGAQNTARQESDDDNQPLMTEPEVESDEALDEVDGNRAPSPLPPEGVGQRQGRPGGRAGHGSSGARGGHGSPGGRGGQGSPGGRGAQGSPGGRGGRGPRGGNRGGNRGGQQGGQDPGRR